MADTIRQLIIDNLITRLQEISIDNGYSADYGYIGEHRLTPLSDNEYPAIVLIDEGQDVAVYDQSKTDYLLHITISTLCNGEESPSQIRNYVADIYKALAADLGCGGYALEIIPVSDVPYYIQEDNVYASLEIKFNIIYSIRSWQLDEQI